MSDPTIIRLALAHYALHGSYAAAGRLVNKHATQVRAWVLKYGDNPPTLEDSMNYQRGKERRAAKAAKSRRLRNLEIMGIKLLSDATGTHRRIEALMALGHSRSTIAAAAGYPDPTSITMIRRSASVQPKTRQRINRAYEQLSAKPGTCNRTRNKAQRHGYAPPLAWDNIDNPNETPKHDLPANHADVDPIAVERALDDIRAGRKPHGLTHAERFEVVARWQQAGNSLRRMELIGWKPERYKSA